MKQLKPRQKYYGKGIHKKGDEGATYRVNGITRLTPAYTLWLELLSRCYSDQRTDSYANTDVTMCEEWLTFKHFRKWFIDTRVDGHNLIRIPGTTEYSPANCVWVPPAVDRALHYFKKKTSPTGVYPTLSNTKWRAKISVDHETIHAPQHYDTKEEAYAWYKQMKIEQIKKLTDNLKLIESIA